jgi:hypothetical protein
MRTVSDGYVCRVLKVSVRNLVFCSVQDAESGLRKVVFGLVKGAANLGEQLGVWFGTGC